MNTYNPDSVSPPGTTLAEYLTSRGMSRRECALLVGCTEQFMDRIIAGDAPITPAIADGLERATSIAADWWWRREQIYRSSRP